MTSPTGGHRRRSAVPDLLDLIPLAVLVADDEGRVLAANHGWEQMTSQAPDDAHEYGWLERVDGAHRDRLLELVRWLTSERGLSVVDHRLAIGDDHPWSRWWLRAATWHGQPCVAMAVADVEADRTRQQELQHRATHDQLTGLVNRAELFDFMDHALMRQHRRPAHLALLFIDLDGFKQINDTHGHATGDAVLKAVGDRLRQSARPHDVVARVGGDEFAILCDDLREPADAHVIAGRIQSALRTPLQAGDTLWQMTATVGLAVSGPAERGETPDSLLDRADREMYRRKAAADRRPLRLRSPDASKSQR